MYIFNWHGKSAVKYMHLYLIIHKVFTRFCFQLTSQVLKMVKEGIECAHTALEPGRKE